MLGIENLKKLLNAGLNFGKSAAKALEDKKVSFFEAIGLVPEVFALIGIGKTWSEVQAEINDLEDDEKDEIYDYVKTEFDIPNDKVETFIESALMNIISLNALIYQFKHINDPIVEG
jgi:hypothetical protein